MLSLSPDLGQEDLLMKSVRENGLTGSQKMLSHTLAHRGLLPAAFLLPFWESVDMVAVHPL